MAPKFMKDSFTEPISFPVEPASTSSNVLAYCDHGKEQYDQKDHIGTPPP